MNANPEIHTCYCLVPHPNKPAFLIVKQDGEWGLPAIRSDTSWHEQHVIKVRDAVEELLGLSTTVLRRLAEGDRFLIYELEVHTRVRNVAVDARWYGRDQHEKKGGNQQGTDLILGEWLEQAQNKFAHVLRRPWERNGWFGQAGKWIDAELARLSLDRTGPTSQTKLTGFGTILETPTSKGGVILKASAGSEFSEAAITEFLAGKWPGYTIPVLAADRDNNCLLMPDFNDRGYSMLPQSMYAKAAGRFADLLTTAGPTTTELQHIGLADFGLDELQRFAGSFASHGESLRHGPAALDESEFGILESRMRDLGDRCAILSGYKIPETLVNLDFRTGNIVVNPSGPMFFDWLEAAISHPFFNVLNLLHEIEMKNVLQGLENPGDDVAVSKIREAFLGPFKAMESEERLNESFSIAAEIFPLVFMKRWLGNIAALEPGSCWAKAFGTRLKDWSRAVITK